MGPTAPYPRILGSQVIWAHAGKGERVKFFPRCSVIGLSAMHLEQSTDSSADCILWQMSTWCSCGNELRSQAGEEKESN